jgi:hypothetical protein
VGWWHAMLKISLVYIEMEEGSGQSMDLALVSEMCWLWCRPTQHCSRTWQTLLPHSFRNLHQLWCLPSSHMLGLQVKILLWLGDHQKLNLLQRLLKLILFMKHDNVTRYNSFMWNWSKSSMCHDVLFISSCINTSIVDEIYWPTTQERTTLGTHLLELP